MLGDSAERSRPSWWKWCSNMQEGMVTLLLYPHHSDQGVSRKWCWAKKPQDPPPGMSPPAKQHVLKVLELSHKTPSAFSLSGGSLRGYAYFSCQFSLTSLQNKQETGSHIPLNSNTIPRRNSSARVPKCWAISLSPRLCLLIILGKKEQECENWIKKPENCVLSLS